MNENKVSCGGFYLGDGLTMDGDTLKSLGGAYVKVSTNDDETFEFMDDSPLKTFEEIVQKMETSLVTLLVFSPDFVYSYFLNDYRSDKISFYALNVIPGKLIVGEISIHSDNKITLSRSEYTLTPAT